MRSKRRLKKEIKVPLVFILTVLFGITLGLLTLEILFRINGAITHTDYSLYSTSLDVARRLPEELFTIQTYTTKSNQIFKIRKLTPNVKTEAKCASFQVNYSINKKGLRDNDYSFNKTNKNTTRFLLFGDSLTFAEGIKREDRATDIIENQTKNFEIINFGVPSRSIEELPIIFKQDASKYEFDYIIIFFHSTLLHRSTKYTDIFFENNIFNYSKIPTNEDLTTIKILKPTIINNKNNFLLNHFQSLNYINYIISKISYQLQKNRKNFFEFISDFKTDSLQKENNKYDENNPEITSKTNKIISALEHELNDSQKIILVNIDYLDKFSFLNNSDNKTIYIDLSDKLFQANKKRWIHFKYDPHYNEFGNKIIAEALLPELEQIIYSTNSSKITQ